MHYLKNSASIISNKEVVTALLERADLEEVTAYLHRYARGD
jgi:hypothetical protein